MRIAFLLDSAQPFGGTVCVPFVIPFFEIIGNFLNKLFFRYFLSYNSVTMSHRRTNSVSAPIVKANFVIDCERIDIVCEFAFFPAVACVNNSVKLGDYFFRNIFEINICATVWVPAGNKNVAIVVVAICPRNWRDGSFWKILY